MSGSRAAAPLPHLGLVLEPLPITGSVDKSLGALTLVTVGGPVVAGQVLDKQLGTLTLVSAGAIGDGAGSLAATLGVLTSTSGGTVTIVGGLSKSLGSISLAVVGGPVVVGTLDKSLSGITFSASCAVGPAQNASGDPAPLPHLGLLLFPTTTIVGSLGKTLGTLTCTSVAFTPVDELPSYDFDDEPARAVFYYPSVSSIEWIQTDSVLREGTGGVVGAASIDLGSVLSVSIGTVTVDGTTAATLGVLASSSVVDVKVSGATAKTLDALTCVSAGDVNSFFVGTSAIVFGALTATGAGSVTLQATASATLGSMTATGAGAVTGGNYIASLNKFLGSLTVSTSGRVDIEGAAASISLGIMNSNLQGSVLWGHVCTVNATLEPMTLDSTADIFAYELGVRRRWTARRTERRIGNRKAKAHERRIEGEMVE